MKKKIKASDYIGKPLQYFNDKAELNKAQMNNSETKPVVYSGKPEYHTKVQRPGKPDTHYAAGEFEKLGGFNDALRSGKIYKKTRSNGQTVYNYKS
tara:strand:- start:3819 stop:4106 length:288 start_codon:yes stop_codon:yes gene_type:complete